MIDTDDVDRTLRAALSAASEDEPPPGDPGPRVAQRVTRRRHRRIATRLGSVIVVAAITAGTIGGLYSSTRTTNPEFDPQSVATPSALLRPQTPADRAPRATFADDTGIVWSTVRLLQSQALARVYGGRDRAGGFCMLVMVDDPNGGTDASADCIAHAPASETEAAAQRFEHQGSALSSYGDGRGAVAFFVPDGIQSVKLGADRIAVEHNSVLVVANHSLGSVMHLRRIGSTLYATK